MHSRVDPVWVSLGDLLGYWCLCSYGAIMPPSGLGFMAKDRPDWVFYGCEIIAPSQVYEKQVGSQTLGEGKSKGERIKEIRKKRGLTQKRLGELCAIDEANIRKYETGKQNPRYETIVKIALALDFPVDYFLEP
ncbi:MAG: helix-turn-helix transcriptional regulator [Anaerotignum propionicum]|nr:helix-turn-helix transcriptional regulator [Anaerotignum propionicum]